VECDLLSLVFGHCHFLPRYAQFFSSLKRFQTVSPSFFTTSTCFFSSSLHQQMSVFCLCYCRTFLSTIFAFVLFILRAYDAQRKRKTNKRGEIEAIEKECSDRGWFLQERWNGVYTFPVHTAFTRTASFRALVVLGCLLFCLTCLAFIILSAFLFPALLFSCR